MSRDAPDFQARIISLQRNKVLGAVHGAEINYYLCAQGIEGTGRDAEILTLQGEWHVSQQK